jgi:hypothetical protein
MFPPSGERKETSALLGPLEGANLNHWSSASHFSLEDGNKSSFRNLFPWLLRIPDDGEIP